MDYANIILEMLDRIKTLEREVEKLKQERVATAVPVSAPTRHFDSFSPPPPGKRDTTRFMFENNVYLKNRLVLATVRAYLRDNPDITREELKCVFPKSLQGSIGVVENAELAQMRPDYTIRFFAKPEETLHLCDGDMYVCSQWGILNIPNFLKVAEQLEYKIESI
ncbi:MAG: hypothetical protein IJW22_02795 [Clostridia bacterium]|nr:hypothetical protein [Clostridia bacterium]